MKYGKVVFYPICFFILSILFFGEASGNEGQRKAADPKACVLSIKFSNHLVTVDLKNAPLETALQELSQKTGAEFTVWDASLSKDPLSIAFADLPLPEAIDRILRNYNYVLQYRDDHSLRVIILASRASGELSPAPSGSYVTVSAEPPGRSITSSSSIGPRMIRINEGLTQAPDPTTDRDECEELDFTREDAARSIPESSGMREEDLKHILQEKRKAMVDAQIHRAQRVLASERCSMLWAQVLKEIESIQDDRVTAILIEAAERGPELLRGSATKALWANVAGSSFKNDKGLSALNGLTGSSDETVSMWAKQAVRDYQQYLKRERRGAIVAPTSYEMKGGERVR